MNCSLFGLLTRFLAFILMQGRQDAGSPDRDRLADGEDACNWWGRTHAGVR